MLEEGDVPKVDNDAQVEVSMVSEGVQLVEERQDPQTVEEEIQTEEAESTCLVQPES